MALAHGGDGSRRTTYRDTATPLGLEPWFAAVTDGWSCKRIKDPRSRRLKLSKAGFAVSLVHGRRRSSSADVIRAGSQSTGVSRGAGIAPCCTGAYLIQYRQQEKQLIPLSSAAKSRVEIAFPFFRHHLDRSGLGNIHFTISGNGQWRAVGPLLLQAWAPRLRPINQIHPPYRSVPMVPRVPKRRSGPYG